jgi:hypothetical protein
VKDFDKLLQEAKDGNKGTLNYLLSIARAWSDAPESMHLALWKAVQLHLKKYLSNPCNKNKLLELANVWAGDPQALPPEVWDEIKTHLRDHFSNPQPTTQALAWEIAERCEFSAKLF